VVNTKALQRELEKLDKAIAALQTEKDGLEQRLMTQLTPAEIAQASKRLKQVVAELDPLEERWMNLSEQVEAAA
jgi:ATP-binding cassette subfamily F protein 3